MPLSKEEFEIYALEIGKFTIFWATVEWGLSAWVSVLFAHYPYDGREPRYPKELRRRIEFIEASYSSAQILSAFKPNALGWLAEIDAIKDERNFIMKGLINMTGSDATRLHVRRVDAKGNDSDLNERRISLARLRIIRESARKVGHAVINHVSDLNRAVAQRAQRLEG